jgi:flavin reductase
MALALDLAGKDGQAGNSAEGSAEFDAIANDFRLAMRRLASTVCVVTACGASGRVGITMTSVTSVSMAPPMLLICVNRTSRLSGILQVGEQFCVNLLRSSQQPEASAFAGGTQQEERFSVGSWDFTTGAPHLTDAQASIFCRVDGSATVGTHEVVIGRVHQVRVSGEVSPLLYSDGRYVAIGAGAVGF